MIHILWVFCRLTVRQIASNISRKIATDKRKWINGYSAIWCIYRIEYAKFSAFRLKRAADYHKVLYRCCFCMCQCLCACLFGCFSALIRASCNWIWFENKLKIRGNHRSDLHAHTHTCAQNALIHELCLLSWWWLDVMCSHNTATTHILWYKIRQRMIREWECINAVYWCVGYCITYVCTVVRAQHIM